MTRQTTSPDGLAYYQATDTPDGAAQGQDLANTTQAALLLRNTGQQTASMSGTVNAGISAVRATWVIPTSTRPQLVLVIASGAFASDRAQATSAITEVKVNGVVANTTSQRALDTNAVGWGVHAVVGIAASTATTITVVQTTAVASGQSFGHGIWNGSGSAIYLGAT
jgi:hypothetical protein